VTDPEALALLARIKADLAELEARLAGEVEPAQESGGAGEDDPFAGEEMLATGEAAQRFGISKEAVQKAVQRSQKTERPLGTKRGGRWEVSVVRMQERMGADT